MDTQGRAVSHLNATSRCSTIYQTLSTSGGRKFVEAVVTKTKITISIVFQ